MGKPKNCCSVQFLILVQIYTPGGVGRGDGGGGVSISREYHVPGWCGNRRSLKIQGTALSKCLQAWPVYNTGPGLRVSRRVVTLLLGVR